MCYRPHGRTRRGSDCSLTPLFGYLAGFLHLCQSFDPRNGICCDPCATLKEGKSLKHLLKGRCVCVCVQSLLHGRLACSVMLRGEHSFPLHEALHCPENEQNGAVAERLVPTDAFFFLFPCFFLSTSDLSVGVLIGVVSPSASRLDTAGLDGVPAGDVPDAAVDKTS